MSSQERKDREDRAWDALIVASFLKGQGDPVLHDDPSILDADDLKTLDAMGPDLVDRVAAGILAGQIPPAPDSPLGVFADEGIEPVVGQDLGTFLGGPEIAALHRGDEQLTPEAIAEMDEQARKLLGGDEEKG